MLLKRETEPTELDAKSHSRREALVDRHHLKTLVVHPSDPTTDFLAPIYRGRSAIRSIDKHETYRAKMLEADRTILLGHGFPQGLAGNGRIIIDDSYADIFRVQPNNIYIFCNADCYLISSGLAGFATGMFISEPIEAQIFNVDASANEIHASNELFSRLMSESVDLRPTQIFDYIKSNYRIAGNAAVEYNRNGLRVFE